MNTGYVVAVRAAELESSVTWKVARTVPSRRLKVMTLGFWVLSTDHVPSCASCTSVSRERMVVRES